MAANYTYISGEPVIVLIPPASSQEMQQVTARANVSGIVFLAEFAQGQLDTPGDVADYLNSLALQFDQYAGTAGVVGLSTVQEMDANNQLVNEINVTVSSTSGRSTSS